jgi:hypothetical protein
MQKRLQETDSNLDWPHLSALIINLPIVKIVEKPAEIHTISTAQLALCLESLLLIMSSNPQQGQNLVR